MLARWSSGPTRWSAGAPRWTARSTGGSFGPTRRSFGPTGWSLGATPGLFFFERLCRFLAGRSQILLRPAVRTEVDCFVGEFRSTVRTEASGFLGELCAAVRAKVGSFIGKLCAAVRAELLFFGTLLSQCSVPSSVPRYAFFASGIYPRPSMLRRPQASAFLVSEKT